jgi:phage terminase large subunit-like protein
MSLPPDDEWPAQLRHFRDFCLKLPIEDGTPLALYPEQVRMLWAYFNGTRETLILIPKKNGKSSLLAALALFHLATVPDASVYIGASSRDQATILFDQAAAMIRRSEYAAKLFDVKGGYREVRCKSTHGRLRVLAADAATADGVIPTLALVDELHRHRSADLSGVFRDGLGARQGQMLTISTAGDDLDSPLGELRQAAYNTEGAVLDDVYRYAETDGFVMHEWSLGDDDDLDDIERVKMANPAPWQTVEELQARHDSPSMRPHQWARFACGVWAAGENSIISAKEWRRGAVPGTAIPAGVDNVFVGIDLGWKRDYTALVPIYRPDPEGLTFVHRPTILKPPGDGTALRAEDIWDHLEEMYELWRPTFVIDPWAGGEQMAQRLDEDLGADVVEHSQKNQPMILAAARLSEAISESRIQHPDDPELNAHVLAAAAKPVGEDWRFAKPPKKDLKIDALVALAMAYSTLISHKPPPKATLTFLD